MLKLDQHLVRQMNDFHGCFLDFIYKVNEVLEYNKIKTSYYKDAVAIYKDRGGSATIHGGNGLREQFELNNNLFWIAYDMLHEIDGQDKHLYCHLQIVLKRIYQKLSDRLIFPEYKKQI
mgnify:CR=1 FL=1|tara:strand:+ start:472 stop:828 length:357 start_codon:yes stop_codon:yes gene_type:complete